MNPTANNASIARVMQTRAELNTRFCNKCKSMIGSSTRRSAPGTASKAAKLTLRQRTERHVAGSEQGCAERIETLPCTVQRVPKQFLRSQKTTDPDRQVYVKNPTPTPMLSDKTSQRRTGAGTQGDDYRVASQGQ